MEYICFYPGASPFSHPRLADSSVPLQKEKETELNEMNSEKHHFFVFIFQLKGVQKFAADCAIFSRSDRSPTKRPPMQKEKELNDSDSEKHQFLFFSIKRSAKILRRTAPSFRGQIAHQTSPLAKRKRDVCKNSRRTAHLFAVRSIAHQTFVIPLDATSTSTSTLYS